MKNSPIALYGNRFVLKGIEAVKVRGPESTLVQHQLLTEIRDNFGGLPELDEDARTEATDDPVGDAFRQVLEGSEESDEEIVWDPRYVLTPLLIFKNILIILRQGDYFSRGPVSAVFSKPNDPYQAQPNRTTYTLSHSESACISFCPAEDCYNRRLCPNYCSRSPQ